MKQCQIIFQFCRQPLTQEECKLLLSCWQNKWFCGFLGGREAESVTLLVSLGMRRAHGDTCVLWDTWMCSVLERASWWCLTDKSRFSLWGGLFAQLKSGYRSGSGCFVWLIPTLGREIWMSAPEQGMSTHEWGLRGVIMFSSQGYAPPGRALGGCFKEGSDAPLCFCFPQMRWASGHGLTVPQPLLLCLYTALGAEIMGLIQSQLQSNHKSFLCLQWGLDRAQSS